jgi:hypothetical protein
MSEYRTLKSNPPKLKIKKGVREVIFTTVSSMCDNKDILRFKKSENGDFTLSTGGFALSNWQMKHDRYELLWAADEGDWQKVINMINTGTSVVSNFRAR